MQEKKQSTGIICWLLILGLCSLVNTLQAEEMTESPVPDAYVARAIFTSDVVNREPIDQVVSVSEDRDSIFFFTDLRNLQGRTIRHRWEFNGQFMGELEFQVGGPRWRVFSRKTLYPGQTGKWTVLVLDESGWPLHASIFMQGEEQE